MNSREVFANITDHGFLQAHQLLQDNPELDCVIVTVPGGQWVVVPSTLATPVGKNETPKQAFERFTRGQN